MPKIVSEKAGLGNEAQTRLHAGIAVSAILARAGIVAVTWEIADRRNIVIIVIAVWVDYLDAWNIVRSRIIVRKTSIVVSAAVMPTSVSSAGRTSIVTAAVSAIASAAITAIGPASVSSASIITAAVAAITVAIVVLRRSMAWNSYDERCHEDGSGEG
jgi:hypothetical protein